MLRNYYYFAASLPHLVFDAEPPFSLNDFLSDAQRKMSTADFRDLERCLKGGCKISSGAGRDWQIFEERLRNEWAAVRAAKKNLHAPDFVRGESAFEPKVVEGIAEALDEDNPLEAERMIDRLCWQFLDMLEAGHLFDRDRITVFGLKLRILERYQRIRSPKGRERLEDLMQSEILKNTLNKISA